MKRIKIKTKPTYEYYKKFRNTWDINPSTRIKPSSMLYNRREKHKKDYVKERGESDDYD